MNYGVLTWDETPDAAGYAVRLEDSVGAALHVFVLAAEEARAIGLYALDLPLGDYSLWLQALGDENIDNSPEVRLAYREKMIRDVEVRTNINFGNSYDDPEDFRLQHFLDFNLKRGLTFDEPSVPPEQWDTAYTAFLAGGASEKMQAAAAIGNDLIVTYYYKDDSGAPTVLLTTGGTPFVKNKLWGGWLWYRDGDRYDKITGDLVPPFSIGGVVPYGTALRVSANIGNRTPAGDGTSISSTQLESVRGRELYVDINVIYRNGSEVRFYKETAALSIADY